MHVIPALSRASSTIFPVKFLGRKSTKTTCVSVPPLTISRPRFKSSSDKVLAFLKTDLIYSLNSGFKASPKPTTLPAIACISGPPCKPGKTAEFTFLAISSSLVKIMPPLPHLNVLCVVEVTT